LSEKPKVKRSKAVINRIVDYFARHPNQVVTIKMISTSTRIPEERIRNSINSFRYYNRENPNHPSKQIETVIRGNSWRYVVPGLPDASEAPPTTPMNGPVVLSGPFSPQDANSSVGVSVGGYVPKAGAVAPTEAPTPTKRVFEEVGPVAGGFVIQDEDEVLYRATRL
jgi:hypothetical protein